ncbi:hypothetical protein ABU630_001208 [Serratia marcescens]|uniref:abortive infection system antitoxin AbiGi family protein n=2 Tax=Serratia marcescens TaxID=615 RepID=UPI0016045872|nr:abortive infection system antitoxin AbiGi family protein [Serratia marcescens]
MVDEDKIKSLYPTALFHFTKEIDSLEAILECQYFEISYAKEIIFSSKSRFVMGIPMVSFCDIRLSQLNEHTIKYGNFGLGMHKSWGERMGLNPVLYMSRQSALFSKYNDRMLELGGRVGKFANEEGKSHPDFLRKVKNYRESANPIRYMKNYQGTLNRIGKKPISNYRFADENEWRYVPGVMETEHFVVSVPSEEKTKKDPKKWKVKFNEELKAKNLRLSFTSDDIKYIIVESDDELDSIIKILKKHFPIDKVDKLISRAFCSKQIYDDL